MSIGPGSTGKMSSTLNPVAFAMRFAAVSFLVRPPLMIAQRPPRASACFGVVPKSKGTPLMATSTTPRRKSRSLNHWR